MRSAQSAVLSDAEVIAESLHDGEAFAAVFDRHCVAVHRYIARRAGRVIADDLVSSTFTVAFDRRRTFWSEADSALPWLLGISTNLLREHWRNDRREDDLLGRLQHERSGTGAPENGYDAEWLEAALLALDSDQRDVLLLYAWGELSYEEIAGALGIPLGTVRSRLHRARGALHAALEVLQAQSEERT